MQYSKRKSAIIILEDGTTFFVKSIGIHGTAFGEVCFNTGMTGYQEIFTDPSYYGQLMVTTNAYIGNYGVREMKRLNLILLKLLVLYVETLHIIILDMVKQHPYLIF